MAARLTGAISSSLAAISDSCIAVSLLMSNYWSCKDDDWSCNDERLLVRTIFWSCEWCSFEEGS